MQAYSVDQLFEHQVAQCPDHLAIVTRTESYTYAELNRFANQIAYTIAARLPTSQTRIGLLFDQSAIGIAALFGVLKSGNAYVPLDPTFPKERTTAIAEDAQIELLLTTAEHLNFAQQLTDCPVMDVLAIDPTTHAENPARQISLDALALILYTSGTTGTPKGVMHSHRTIVQNFWRQWEIVQFQPSDRMSLLYSPSVMGAVRGIFNALLAGATLYPFSIKARGLLRFVELIQQEKLTVIHCVASLFRNITSVLNGTEDLSSLRLVMMGGEATTQQDFEDFRRYFPRTCQFYVGMGSTEGGSLCAQILTHQSQVTTALISPGYPCQGIEIKILDEDGSEVPAGEIGEIAIDSNYLALGYWNRPDLNATAFESVGTTRRFKTGDLGQFLPDGRLAHCGRKDFQVKIRGFRIEVSEIERVLLNAGVQDAVVVSPKHASGETYLVAFVVPKSGVAVQIDALRDRIHQALPDYMMPSQFWVLDELPRTPNGKVDRRALLNRDIQLERTLEANPQTELEHQLVEIWREVLKVPPIGLHDRFFDLGGHSLAMAQIVAQIEQKISARLPVAALFEASTVQQLASLIEAQKNVAQSPLIAFHQIKSDFAPLFCFPGAGDHFRFCQGFAAHLREPHPIYGIREVSPKQYESIEAIASVHVQTLKETQPEGAYHLVGYSFGALIALEVAQQLHAQGNTIALLALIDPSHPPIRFRAMRLLLKQFPSRSWRKLYRVLYRAEVHYLRLLELNLVEKLGYFQDKLNLATQLISRKLFGSTAKESPEPVLDPAQQKLNEIWDQYDLYLQLRDRYVPQAYDQPVILFLSECRAKDAGQWRNWNRLLSSSSYCSIFSTNHHTICEEPSIREIVRPLATHLKQSLPMRQSS